MSDGESNHPLPDRGLSTLQTIGLGALAILLYILLIDVAVEAYLSRSLVQWWAWVSGAVAAYLLLNAVLWRRLNWATQATLSWFVLLGLVVSSAWLPGGLTQGVTLVFQPTSTVLSALTALAILLAGIGLARLKFIPISVRVAVGLVAVYGVTAFGLGIVTGTSYSDLFHGRSFWEGVRFWWLQGAFLGALVVPLALVVQIVYGLLRVRGAELRGWSVQVLALSVGLAIAVAGLRGPYGISPWSTPSIVDIDPSSSITRGSDISTSTSKLDVTKVAAQVTSQPGVVARYFADHSYNSLKKSVVEKALSLEWISPPVTPVDGKSFWVEWEGLLRVSEKGKHNFKIEGDGNGFLYIDGKRVIRERRRKEDQTPLEGSLTLEEAGTHTIRLAAIQDQTAGTFALKWKNEGDPDYSFIDPQYLTHADRLP